MARIAYLGPECSFSHDLLRKEFGGTEHVAYECFHDIVKAVAAGECPKGVVPFYNTTRLGIEESQREIVASLGRVHVTDVIPFDVKHYCCAFCGVGEIKEIWSKSVVRHQVSDWMAGNLPGIRWVDKLSTSAAIEELGRDRPAATAAIGTLSAARRYKVPVVAKHVNNKPNITLFFVIERGTFHAEGKDHILLCLPHPSEEDILGISELALIKHCSVSSNWVLDAGRRKKGAYFVELCNSFSTLDLHAAVDTVRRSIRRVSICGGYTGKSITQLIWSDRQWPQGNKP